MIKNAEIAPASPTLQASLEKVRQTILTTILRYNGVKDNTGKQETVLDHVNGMKTLSTLIKHRYPSLTAAINFDEVDIMADLHDSGEANPHGDLSRGRPDYNALRSQYDEYEKEFKEQHVFTLFVSGDREYVQKLDYRFEHRDEGQRDKEGLMTRILDKAQTLTIFDRGFITNTLRSLHHGLSEEEFEALSRQNMVESCIQILEPGKMLLNLLSSNPQAQKDLLLFLYQDIFAPLEERGYSKEIISAAEQVFESNKVRRTSPS